MTTKIIHNIHRIDKKHINIQEMITNSKWDRFNTYHLVVDTTNWSMKELTPAIADFVIR